MTGAELQILLVLVEKLGPSIVSLGIDVFRAIEGCQDLSPAARDALIIRATEAHAKAMNYKPRQV
jgi:hypothetical protein